VTERMKWTFIWIFAFVVFVGTFTIADKVSSSSTNDTAKYKICVANGGSWVENDRGSFECLQ
jgi:hypothetical protein